MTKVIDDIARIESGTIDAILRDIDSLKRDIAGATRGLSHDIADATRDMTRDAADQLATKGTRAAKAITLQIEEQPIASLVLAFALGYLGSRILLR